MDEKMAGTAGGPKAAPLDALTLRRIAEWASGVRGEKLWFVVDPHSTKPWKTRIRVFKKPPRRGDYTSRETVIPIHTDQVNPGRPKVEYGELGPTRELAVDLMDVHAPDGTCHEADAVFWSESSVEKFVVPYYASKHGHNAEEAIRDVLDVLHRPVRPLGAGEEQEPTWGPGDPFALVHVPTSEYLPASDGEGDEAAALIHSEFFAARISRTDAQRVEWVNLAEVAKERRQAPPPREERG